MSAAAETPFTPPEAINPGLPWPTTDALDRTLPTTVDAAAGIRPNRTVGIFYFLSLDYAGPNRANNVPEILAQDPDILQKPNSPLWGPPGRYYWGQPLFGYYSLLDPWVLRRHANLLVDAGVDVVVFATTNAITYPKVYLQLCDVWSQMRREGERTPQICFMLKNQAEKTSQQVFQTLYKPGRYPELWFRWKGKPLLICDPANVTPELREFFTLRTAFWPLNLHDSHNAWHWESTYPQVVSYDDDARRPEQINVSVAQNLRVSDGKVTNFSQRLGRGRSFHDGAMDPAPDAINRGPNFAEQWRRAIEADPAFVLITGWNEWAVGKFSRRNLPVVFVDQFDQQYSRDVEPVQGLHRDNYYYQMVDGIRRYKGVIGIPRATAAKSIDLDAGFAQWREIAPEFTDHAHETDHRDFGTGARHYINASGRNDIVAAKVSRDEANVYFYVRTREPLTPSTDANWMWLLIDRDGKRETGWEGYDFIVNRTTGVAGAWLERNAGGWNWTRVVKIEMRTAGNEMMLAIPCSAIGLVDGAEPGFDFKWWDNSQKPGDIMDTYISGDTAPDGRFNFRYLPAK